MPLFVYLAYVLVSLYEYSVMCFSFFVRFTVCRVLFCLCKPSFNMFNVMCAIVMLLSTTGQGPLQPLVTGFAVQFSSVQIDAVR